jgi:RNA polymerase sigma-70 factor (ECF subfamily)
MMPESKGTERELEWVDKAQAGDLGAFESLAGLYENRIYSVAYRFLDNESDAEDVLQEAFLKAFENLSKFRKESSFYTWIMQIAVNASLQRLNQRRKWPMVSLDESNGTGDEYSFHPQEVVIWDEDPEKLYSQKELRGILNAAISSLPFIYRSVFILKDLEHLSAEQAAQMLGISLPAAKSRLIRARLELRERLGKYFRRKGAVNLLADHNHGY